MVKLYKQVETKITSSFECDSIIVAPLWMTLKFYGLSLFFMTCGLVTGTNVFFCKFSYKKLFARIFYKFL
ncbi:hypothetical protein Fmac_015543 [Flemingia macrophylla]|uniref:Uncharacterized protein n=1 Tax=Flemingia macrophylla TaxID=520843 RepID=A0ABD1MEV5_9FABA